MGQDELLNNSAQLLRHSTLASLCRMCRTKERKGPLKIDGAYAWPVVQRAFDGFGEWNITRKPGWNVRSISVREQAKLGKSLSFEVCAGLHRHWLSQSELCVVMQNLKTSRKLRRGAMVMNTQGEGFCWLASESAPFTIEHKISTDGLSSALSVLGFIGRLDLSGDMHYPEGIREDPQVKQTLIDDRRAAQQQRTQQTKTKRIPKAKPKISKPKKSWELTIGVDGEYRGGIYIPYDKPKQRCFVFIYFCFGERASGLLFHSASYAFCFPCPILQLA